MDNKVWIVSYCDDGDKEATVTAFNNEDAAKACYEHFKLTHDKCSIDECCLYSGFYDGVKWTPELKQLERGVINLNDTGYIAYCER